MITIHYTLKCSHYPVIMINSSYQKLVACRTEGQLLLSGFQALVTLKLDQVIRHTVVHESSTSIYTVSQKNVPPLACFDAHEWILIFFGRNVTDKVGNQKTPYYATSNNLCFCTAWQNAETWKSHISLNCIVLRHKAWLTPTAGVSCSNADKTRIRM